MAHAIRSIISNDGDFTIPGNVTLSAVGDGFKIKEGTNATMGTATLVTGTVVVSTTKVTASSRIMLTGQDGSANVGSVWVSARTAGTSFTISSTNVLDSRAVGWLILEPS